MNRNTYGVNDSPAPFQQVYDSLVILTAKNAAGRHQPLQNENHPTKQRVPRSHKTGRRGDSLSTFLDQTPDFAPILF